MRVLMPCWVVACALAACGGGDLPPSAPVVAAVPSPLAQQASDPTTGALRVFHALHGRTPTSAEFRAFTTPDSAVLATGFASMHAGLSDAALATTVLSNMGVTPLSVNGASYAILEGALAQYFAAYGPGARGVIVNNLVGLLAGLESDVTWGAAARGFNTTITAARAVLGASTSGGGACAPTVVTGFAGEIETTGANAGAGDGGSAGSGGGAAAGGGLGKVLGGTMTVVDLSTGNTVGSGTTDAATGLVTIRTCGLSGPFLLTLEGKAGARYFDEGKNALVDFPAGSVLHALVDRWDEHVGVSPLTEAAYRYALNNFRANPADVAAGRAALRADGSLTGLTASEVVLANNAVREEVNRMLTTGFQLQSNKALPTPIDASSGTSALPDSRYGRSAAVTGGLVKAANFFQPAAAAPALRLSDDLARDLTDGRIDGFALDRTQAAPATTTTYESVRLPLAANIGSNAVAQRFAVGTLHSSTPTIDEAAFLAVFGSELEYQNTGRVRCDAITDDVYLMSDGSVTIRRMYPVSEGGRCFYRFDANTRAEVFRSVLTEVRQVISVGPAVFAVKRDGTVMGWGENYCGRLSPMLANRLYTEPQVIPGLRDVTSIGGDWDSAIARTSSGKIYTWGFNGNAAGHAGGPGLLCGNGANSAFTYNFYQDTALREVTGLSNVIEVYSQASNYFALTSEGDVYGWGEGYKGLLANSSGAVDANGDIHGPRVDTPTRLPGLSGVRKLSFTLANAWALLNDGTVKAWGSDANMLLGAGVRRPTAQPTAFTGLTDIAKLESGIMNGLRMQKRDGTLLYLGALSGSTTPRYTPTPFTPAEPIRHFKNVWGPFAFYTASGKLLRDLNETFDQTQLIR